MFESFRDRDLKDTGSRDEPGAGAPVVPSKGDHSGEFDRRCKTKHTQREGLYVLRRSELGVEESVTIKRHTSISRVLSGTHNAFGMGCHDQGVHTTLCPPRGGYHAFRRLLASTLS